MFAEAFAVTVTPIEDRPVEREIKTGWRTSVWPVVCRELREAARRPANHRLRLLSGIVGTFLLAVIVTNSDDSTQALAGRILGGLHAMLLGLIFLIVPALAADCIAREHRDGTMGLLFLTPLKPGGIIAGKMIVQALRAGTLWLTVLPLLAIPFLTGGVTWFDALSALSLEFCAATLCLAAGVLASTLARERINAFLLAFLFAALFLMAFGHVLTLTLVGGWRGWAGLKDMDWRNWLEGTASIVAGIFGSGGMTAWSSFARYSSILARIWQWLCWSSPVVALLIFFAVNRFAATRLKCSWQDRVPSARREKLRRRYCTPLFRRWSQRRAQRALDMNPIAWLQQYSWKARLRTWILFLAFLVLGDVALVFSYDDRELTFNLLLVVLTGCYLFAGVNGFLQEKRNGALEMLLVTPLSAGRIIFGRVWGLWKQFFPVAAVLAVCYLDSQLSGADGIATRRWILILACGFLLLPVFATYFALRAKNLLMAAALTLIATWLPVIFSLAAAQFFVEGTPLGTRLFLPLLILVNAAFAFLACSLLRHSLSRRIYSF